VCPEKMTTVPSRTAAPSWSRRELATSVAKYFLRLHRIHAGHPVSWLAQTLEPPRRQPAAAAEYTDNFEDGLVVESVCSHERHGFAGPL
jgi:hypothetical protein